jgi:hypothetical protein
MAGAMSDRMKRREFITPLAARAAEEVSFS